MECGQWGTIDKSMKTRKQENKKTSLAAYETIATSTLEEIQGKNVTRISTQISEMDRVLGGGIVPGSLILLGGEPGIGKSTLAMQLAIAIPHTVYFSGEESVEQLKLRADRLHLNSLTLRLANTSTVEDILGTMLALKPPLVIIDSIQTIASEDASGEPGSVTQIRTCAAKILEVAKGAGIAVILVGHVTKDGMVAGPKTLEHLVDTVLYFEGERHHNIRLLRAVKNRFGSTDEVGMFDMSEVGLREVKNVSALLLAERGSGMPGSVVTCLMEGTRCVLVEIQALVNKTVFGYPVRKASGFDLNRLHVLIAVLQRRANVNLSQYDVHINVVGGLEASEPAADLAVCLAVASAYKDKSLGLDLAVFGEVGLGGEVRSVGSTDKRLKECEQLGMKRAIMASTKKPSGTKLTTIEVKNIQELITHT